MKNTLLVLLGASLLSACNSNDNIFTSQPQTIHFDFDTGKQGWEAAYSDYPSDNADTYELSSGILTLPNDSTHNGFFMGGTNRSDDLFMYIKSHFSGLQGSARYIANISIDLVSNAGDNCFGAGGAPGESVYVKFGFGEIEPKQSDYYLNLDKGNQSTDGTNAKVIGNVVVPGLACEGGDFGSKTLATTSETQLEFTSSANGSIWLFVGTDSGYEGRTEVYYDKISITVQPAL
ncbi:hypothetical protein [Neptunicella sp. SCSIO 80796]|uniref:hypothetical protein n=1 Tax=Neptunicella plasticusilytica TaxID=3117012 RepID=UPI003A4E23D8